MRSLITIFAFCMGGPVLADSVIAARTIRPQTILTAQDLATSSDRTVGAYTEIAQMVGQETRVALYAGRPVRIGDIGPPAIVDRNQIVVLTYAAGGLTITTDARALGRGGVGEQIRLLNMASRVTVEGVILPDGTVRVR